MESLPYLGEWILAVLVMIVCFLVGAAYLLTVVVPKEREARREGKTGL